MITTGSKKKLGLAMSGAAARSVFYLGFLEVLEEHKVRVEVIAAQSGASVVAASYACGTLAKLKADIFAMNWHALRQLLSKSRRGGIYSLDIIEEYIRTHITGGAKFEDLSVRLCFGASNLDTGRIVAIGMGDLARGIRITCSLPGLFEPVVWGNQTLVDGGVLSVLPAKLAKDAGADVLIGLSVRSTKHVFLPTHIKMRRGYNYIKNLWANSALVKATRHVKQALTPSGQMGQITPDIVDEKREYSAWRIVTRSLDLAIDVTKTEAIGGDLQLCDLVIQEGEGKYGDSINLNKTESLYRAGRQSALANLSRIQALID